MTIESSEHIAKYSYDLIYLNIRTDKTSNYLSIDT